MATARQRECLCCGMLQMVHMGEFDFPGAEQYCEKCDNSLLSQSDGSTLSVDIAHQHETVPQALDKLERALNRAWQGYTGQLRLVVGGGVIRENVLGELYFLESKGRILGFEEAPGNRGAVLVLIRENSFG